MKFMNDLYTKIEAYLDESMSPSDRAAFEKELSKNADLAEEVEINRQMLLNYDEDSWAFAEKKKNNPEARALETYLKSEEADVLSDTIEKAGSRYKNHTKSIRRRKFFYYAAASVVILLLAGNFFISQNTTESLYSDYSDWESLTSLTSRGEDNSTLSQGEQFFKQEKYAEAITVFNTYRAENNTILNTQMLIYLGVSYLESGQYENAISTFDELQNSNTLDSENAQWYKALTYLKQGDKEQVKQQLESMLSNPEHPYFDKAGELMGKLK